MVLLITFALAAAAAQPTPAAVAIVDTTVEVGDGTRLEHATVVFRGDRIVAVGADVAVPAGATRIDGRGKVTSPGLVATLSQVGLFEVGMEDNLVETSLAGAMVPGFRVADGYNPLSFHIGIDREEGVTTAILSPTGNQLVAGQASVVELRTSLDATPDVTRPVAMVGSFDGGVAGRFGGARGGLLLGLRTLVDDTRTYLRTRAAYDRAQSRPLSVDRAHLEAMIPVVQGKLPFVVHVDRAADIRTLVEFARSEKLKLIIASGAESWLVADLLVKNKVPVIVLPSMSGQRSFDAMHGRDDLAAVLVAAGVDVIVTTWDTDNGTTRLRQEAGIAVQNGLDHGAAIKAITQTPARIFGVQQAGALVGVVAVGARATVVLWSGDPLEALTVAERIWIGGERQSTPSRQRLLSEKYLPAVRAAAAAKATAAPTTPTAGAR